MKLKEKTIYAPVEGKVEELAVLKDGVFSEKMLGDGGIIDPGKKAGKLAIISPIAGKIETSFETGHAYGIKNMKSGLEVLVHIGIDTVYLEGEGFEAKVKKGSKVKEGDVLAIVDFDLIAKKAVSHKVIVVVTSGQRVAKLRTGNVVAKEPMIEYN